jgi:hypothetical protein
MYNGRNFASCLPYLSIYFPEDDERPVGFSINVKYNPHDTKPMPIREKIASTIHNGKYLEEDDGGVAEFELVGVSLVEFELVVVSLAEFELVGVSLAEFELVGVSLVEFELVGVSLVEFELVGVSIALVEFELVGVSTA